MEKAYWITLNGGKSQLAYELQQELSNQIQSMNLFQFIHQNGLQSINSAAKNTVFIHTTLGDYENLYRDPDIKNLLKGLHVELLNSRLISLPFYLLGIAQSRSSLKGTVSRLPAMEIAFITLPMQQIHPVQEADLLTMLSQILSKPKTAIRLYREREAYTAAKRLYEGNYDLVGIYEDEPATLLDEFQINLSEELKAQHASLLIFDSPPSHIQTASPERLNYVFQSPPPYQGGGWEGVASHRNPATNASSVAIVQEAWQKLPVVLSNVRQTRPELWGSFSKALSNSYFLMIPKVSEKDPVRKQALQGTFLWNAYIHDPENRWKALGFLGHLLLMKDLNWKERREKDVYDQKCVLFQKELGVPRLSARSIFEWLGMQVPELEKRELFTDDVSGLYESALKKIDQGRDADRSRRIQIWEEAKRTLIAAMLQAEEPKNIKGTRGLWSTSDYNPYYQLARVILYLQKENG